MAKNQPNFEQTLQDSILDWPSEMIVRPKPLPSGTYLTVLQGQPNFGKSSQKQTDFAEFSHKLLQAGDDVDKDDLEAFLTSPNGTKKKLQETIVKQQFYITDTATYRLKDFCKILGINVGPGTNARQWIAETAGKQCFVHVKHKPWLSGEGVSANIDETISAE